MVNITTYFFLKNIETYITVALVIGYLVFAAFQGWFLENPNWFWLCILAAILWPLVIVATMLWICGTYLINLVKRPNKPEKKQ